MSRAVTVLACGLALAATSTPSAAAGAGPPPPSVFSVSASPGVLPSGGGIVTLTARVSPGASCTLSDGAVAVAVRCASGLLSVSRRLAANDRPRAAVYRVFVVVHARGRAARSKPLRLLVKGTATRPPPTAGVAACAPGPQCDYGAGEQDFPTWGNAPNAGVSDCTFAAAANWEQVVLGWEPYMSAISEEFAQAGGNTQTGLEQAALWSWWEREGIAGSYLTSVDPSPTTPAALRAGVRAHKALIAQLHLTAGWRIGRFYGPAGLHDVLVVGFTPPGPLIVSWGRVLQLSWGQWAAWAVGLWSLTATTPEG